MKSRIYYKALFGLTFASEIILPELNASSSAADVTIRNGKVPEKIENPMGCGAFYQLNEKLCLLCLDDIVGARYLIRNGDEIIVEQQEDADEDDIRLFLLGTCMAALLFQRGCLPLHASAIQTSRGAVLFAGTSGSGKSTTAGALQLRGYPSISDDICVIEFDSDGNPYVVSGIPHIKLWKDAADVLKQQVEEEHRVRSDIEKFRFPHSYPMPTSPIPIDAIHILQPANIKVVEHQKLPGMKSISALHKTIYREKLGLQMGRKADFFAQISKLAQRVTVNQIRRPRHPFMLDELITVVEETWLEEKLA